MMNDTRGQSSEEKGGKREWGRGLFTIHTPQCSFLFFSSILDQRHKDTMWTFHRHVVIEHWVDTSGLMLVSFYILVCRTSWRNNAYVNSLSLFYTIHPLAEEKRKMRKREKIKYKNIRIWHITVWIGENDLNFINYLTKHVMTTV